MRRVVLILSALLFALAACGPQDIKIAEGPETDYGKSLFTALHQRNVSALRSQMDPRALATTPASVLDQMAALFPHSPPRSITVVGLNRAWFSGNKDMARRVEVSLQYEFEDTWLVGSVIWRETAAGHKVVEAMDIQPLTLPLAELNRFTLAGKSVVHYLILTLAVTLPLFSCFVLFLCLRAPMPWKRKTLWSAGILFGFGQISLNWTNGAVSLNPFLFSLLSAGWIRPGPVGPYIISVSVPLFALLFLRKQRQGKRSAAKAAPSTDLSEE